MSMTVAMFDENASKYKLGDVVLLLTHDEGFLKTLFYWIARRDLNNREYGKVVKIIDNYAIEVEVTCDTGRRLFEFNQ